MISLIGVFFIGLIFGFIFGFVFRGLNMSKNKHLFQHHEFKNNDFNLLKFICGDVLGSAFKSLICKRIKRINNVFFRRLCEIGIIIGIFVAICALFVACICIKHCIYIPIDYYLYGIVVYIMIFLSFMDIIEKYFLCRKKYSVYIHKYFKNMGFNDISLIVHTNFDLIALSFSTFSIFFSVFMSNHHHYLYIYNFPSAMFGLILPCIEFVGCLIYLSHGYKKIVNLGKKSEYKRK